MIFLFNQYRILQNICWYNFKHHGEENDHFIDFDDLKNVVPLITRKRLRLHCRTLVHLGCIGMTYDDNARITINEEAWAKLFEFRMSAYRKTFSALWAILFTLFGAILAKCFG